MPYFELLICGCEFFLVESQKEIDIPLIGDISPDFCPKWLIDLPNFINRKKNSKIKNPSWQNIWTNSNETLKLVNNKNSSSKLSKTSLIYPNSGWYRFQFSDFIMFLRVEKKGVPDYVGHHHHDAGHFCLFYKGIPIFVDAGRLNYKENFGIKPEAHNTIKINNLGCIPNKQTFFQNIIQIVKHCISSNKIRGFNCTLYFRRI